LKHKVTLTLELTDEDIAAARHQFFGGWAEAPQLTPQDVVKQLLRPSLESALPRQVYTPVEGSWECATSPTKVCWYDDQTDTVWDDCLFCGQPHERK